MPRILTLFLMLHWAIVFSLLAAFSVFDTSATEGLRTFGVQMMFSDALDGRSLLILRALVAFGFTICAVLFWWTLATLALSLKHETPQTDDVLRVAFSAASLLMTGILLLGAFNGADHLLSVMAMHVAALIASYVAVQAELENLPMRPELDPSELRLAARVRALDASQVAVLARFTPNQPTSGRLDR